MVNIVKIDENDIKYLNEPAKREVAKAGKEYCLSVIKEAARIETATHSSQTNPEITSSHVKDAATYLSKGYVKPKKSLFSKIVKFIAGIGLFAAGLLYDTEKFTKDQLLMNIFMLVLIVGIVAFIYDLSKE